jgi:hypothetical protein
MSKMKIVPKTPSLTIPKLELLSIYCAANLAQYIHNELKIKIAHIIFYSDSMISLCWIRNGEVKKTWAHNRVTTINKISNELKDKQIDVQFRYISTNENPADFLTRGQTLHEMEASSWYKGPPFLEQPLARWPNSQLLLTARELELVTNELKHPQHSPSTFVAQTVTITANALFPLHRYSSLQKAERIVAKVLLAIEKFKLRSFKNRTNQDVTTIMNMEEECLEKATVCIILDHQRQFDIKEEPKNNIMRVESQNDIICQLKRLLYNIDLPIARPVLIAKSHLVQLIIK